MRATITALMLALAPASLMAQQTTEREPRTISVSAQATVEREPDRAIVMLAVESQAETAEAAASANADLMTRVLAAVRKAGVPERQIRTVNYDLQPVYSQPDPREPRPANEAWEPRIVAYRAHNMVRVEIDGVANVGGVIDAALGAGANRVDGVHFDLQDRESAENDALQEAVEQARSKANAAAQAAGQQLGQPLSINVGSYGRPMPTPMYRAEAMDMAQSATPIQGGTLEIAASVTITYELIGG
ncbi:MAG: SIMPL domain-containing protein [Longimicrobiales bacterium]